MTYLLLMNGLPICFHYDVNPKNRIVVKDPDTGLGIWKKESFCILTIKASRILKSRNKEVFAALTAYLEYKAKIQNPFLEEIEYFFGDVKYISC